MRVALVHDFLTQYGGAEKVLSVLRELYPDAPVFTLVRNKNVAKEFLIENVRSSFLQRFPMVRKYYRGLLPLMPWATERFDLSDYDLVISSSSAFVKGVITSAHSLHICYCHTPTRYLWSDTYKYVNDLPYLKFFKAFIPAIFVRLRMWDFAASQRPDIMIANSETVKQRIKKYYRRDSVVIYPPVDLTPFAPLPTPQKGDYFLTGGRLVTYKRFDLVVEAFNRLRLPLKVFGDGPARRQLEAMAKENIEFVGFQPIHSLANLYSNCRAFIYPQEEDFGITAVEAMASGRPVIAYKQGGAMETVRASLSGQFFDEQSWEAIADSVVHFNDENYDAQKIRAEAERFSVKSFKEKFEKIVEENFK